MTNKLHEFILEKADGDVQLAIKIAGEMAAFSKYLAEFMSGDIMEPKVPRPMTDIEKAGEEWDTMFRDWMKR